MTIDEIKELMETGEEFITSVYGPRELVKFVNFKIFVRNDGDEWVEDDDMTFNDLFNSDIIRKPWKPKVGNRFWFWGIDDVSTFVTNGTFIVTTGNLINIAFGNCFRTKEECEKHTEVRDKLIEMRKEYMK